MEFIEFIPRIVKGFEFKQGSMVLLNFWGENKDLDILDRFAIEIGKLGAVPVKIQQSREFAKDRPRDDKGRIIVDLVNPHIL